MLAGTSWTLLELHCTIDLADVCILLLLRQALCSEAYPLLFVLTALHGCQGGTTQPALLLPIKPKAERKSNPGRQGEKARLVRPCCSPSCTTTGDRLHCQLPCEQQNAQLDMHAHPSARAPCISKAHECATLKS